MQIDKQWLQDPWVRSMLPESDKNANLMALGFGMFSLVLGYGFTKITPKDNNVLAIDVTKKDVAASTNIADLTKKLKEEKKIEPPKPDPQIPKTKSKPEPKVEKDMQTQKVESNPNPGPSGAKGGGGGPPRGAGNSNKQSRGVLALIKAVSTKSGLEAYGLANSKVMTDVNKTLSQFAGVKKFGASEYAGRRGKSDGFNEGFAAGGKGFGMGSGSGGGLGGGTGSGFGNTFGGGGGGFSTKSKGSGSGAVRPPSNAELDLVDEGGGRSKADIMRVVRARSPGLRYIFNKFQKTGLTGGKVSIRFTIAPDGAVVGASKAGSTTGNSGFDSEIVSKVKEWNFGAAPNSGNTTVTIPLTFTE